MNKQEQLVKILSKMIMAYDALDTMGKINNLVEVAHGMGYSTDRIVKALDFIHGQVGKMNEGNIIELVERDAHIAYLECIDEIEKHMKIATGYQEMGEINLKISQDSFQAEEEGERKVNEMVAKDTEGDTKEG